MTAIRLSLLAAVAAMLCISVSSFADNAAPNKGNALSAQDQEFVNKAYNINTTEVRLGQIAEQKGTNGQVKEFAQHMVKDHTKLNHDLKTLVSENRAALPAGIDKHHQQLVDRLSKLSGSDFDKQYMDAMINGHEQAVGLFEKEAADPAQTVVDKWAAQVVPTLKEHLQMAVNAGKAVGAPAANEGGAVPARYHEHPSGK